MDQQYEIIDGVRRAKAVLLAGGSSIRARLYDSTSGVLLGEVTVPIDSLRSPHKTVIGRAGRADNIRWQRVVLGTQLMPPPFPPIEIQMGGRGIKIEDLGFDFGVTP